MGLFSPNYNKPGPGVEKDAPPKPRFFVFFEVFQRKFWNLIKVNLMFSIFNFPALVIAFFASLIFMQKLNFGGDVENFIVRLFLSVFLVSMSMITMGPVQAGITYILRNYSREEHAFIWWDFKENFKKNFKQGLAISAIDILVMFILGVAFNFYTNATNLVYVFFTAVVILSILIFTMMHFYIYPMLVTVNLGIKNIYKNALIFSIIKLLPNLFMVILNLAIVFIAFINAFIGGVLYLLILPSFLGLMNNFFVNPIIKKYVITTDENEDIEEDDEEADKNKDDGDEEVPEDSADENEVTGLNEGKENHHGD